MNPRPLPGDPVAIYVQEDPNGDCLVTPQVVQEYMPESTTCYFYSSPQMEDVNAYLKGSGTFANLIAAGLEEGLSGEGNVFNVPNDGADNHYCLLVFQYKNDGPYLTGFYAGTPRQEGEGTWVLDVARYDYYLAPLYEEESKVYWENKESLLTNYVALEDVPESGAVYYLKGTNTGQSADMSLDDWQMYHLWNRYNSPARKRYARDMKRLGRDVSRINAGRYTCFLLLDEKQELIGYTVGAGS